MQEKFFEFLDKAQKSLQTADHLTYITFPLIKDKRLLFKILEQLNETIISTINAILQYEYLYKRIMLSKDPITNLETFYNKCAFRYQITDQQLKNIQELIHLNQRHKKSPFEFIRKEKVVIMSENLKTEVLTVEKLKSFIIDLKDILRKTDSVFKRVF